MLKVVLDTNIIVSSTISSKSHPTKILDHWREKRFEVIITPATIAEMWQVLFRPGIRKYRKFSDKQTKNFLLELQKEATFITPTLAIKVIEKDPADDEFVIAAVEGKADYIVSGDKHLLELGSYKGIQVVTPKEFLDILERKVSK